MTILPTHTCFDDALDWVSEAVVKKGKTDLFLVHGIQCISTLNGDHLFAHAWIEEGDLCWDFGILQENGAKIAFAVQRAEYYAERQCRDVTRYTPFEACRENYNSNHFGPWKEKYRALCGREPTVLGVTHASILIPKQEEKNP